MKKILTFILGMMVVASCDHLSKSSSDKEEEVNIADLEGMAFETEKLSYSYEEDKVEVSIDVEYPKDGNPILVNAIREYISETMGGTYDGDLEEGQQLVDYYGGFYKKELNDEKQVQIDENDGNDEIINGFYRNYDIKKEYETDHFITYLVNSSVYLNGAHGVESSYGMTFRKSDGRRFGTDMMRNLYSQDIYALIKKGLIDYFGQYSDESVTTDEDLKEYILTDDDVNYLPLPKNVPYITQEGFVFTYQPYEISFYAAGMPTFTVPVGKMKQFLTQTALKMLGED